MDRYTTLQYINAYNYQPYQFDDEQLDYLEESAKQHDIPFQRNIGAEENKQTSAVGQFMTGLAEGWLGPLYAGPNNDPVTSAQQISRSIGSLIGFVPGLAGGPLAWAGKGLLKAGTKTALRKGVSTLGTGTEAVGNVLKSQVLQSVPMRGADILLGKKVGDGALAKLGSAGEVAQKFMFGPTVGGDIVKAAAHLGTASAVSEFWEGPNAIFDSFVHGAVAGGAFGTIGNYRNLLEKATGKSGPVLQKLAENKLMEGTLKAMAGAGFQGGLTALYDAPTPVVIYETLLGGYFGAVHPSVGTRRGKEWFSEYYNDPNKKPHEMLNDPAIKNMKDPDMVAEIERMHFENIGNMMDRHLTDVDSRYDWRDRSAAAQNLRNEFKDEAYNDYSTKNNIKRNEMTNKDKADALKEILEPRLELEDVKRKSRDVAEEIDSKNPKEYTGEVKQVFESLTKEEIALVESGRFDPIYNYFLRTNPYFKTWDTVPRGEDILRMEEQAISQRELDSSPTFSRIAKDLAPKVPEKLKLSENEIISTLYESFEKTYLDKVAPPKETKDQKRQFKTLLEAQKYLEDQAPKEQLGKKPLRYIKPKEGQPFLLFRGLSGLKLPKGMGAEAEFYSHDPRIAEEYSNRLLDRATLDRTEGEVIRYEKGANPRVYEIEYTPNKILDTTKPLSKELKEKLRKAGVNERTIDDLDKAKDLGTADLQSLQRDKLFFDTVKKEGYDLIQFMDYTSVGVDLSFVPLKSTKPRNIYDTKWDSKNYEKSIADDPLSFAEPKDGFQNFKKDVLKKLEVELSDELNRDLIKSYEMFKQNRDYTGTSYEFDVQTGTIRKHTEYNSIGENRKLSHTQEPHKRIYNYKDDSYTITETIVNGRSYNILGKYFKEVEPGKFDYMYVMEGRDWKDMLSDITNKNSNHYMWSSEKDKGKLIVRPFHPETNNTKLSDAFNQKELMVLLKDRKEFFKLLEVNPKNKNEVEKFKKLHQKMAISNKLYDPIGEFKNALDLVKRASVMSSKDYALDPAKFADIAPDGKINVVMVNDVKSVEALQKSGGKVETFFVKDGEKKVKKVYDSDIDGYVVMHTKLFDKIVESMGLDPTTSHIKPTIATMVDGRLFILKGGIHPSQVGVDRALTNPNTMVVMTSAGKVHPGKEYIHKANKNGKYEFFDSKDVAFKNPVKKPESFQINVNDLLINLGVYGDKHALDPVTIKRQFHSVLNRLNMGDSPEGRRGYKALMEAFSNNYRGDKDQNLLVRRMLNNPTMKMPEDFDVTRIGHKEITRILNEAPANSEIMKALVKDIIRDYKNAKPNEAFEETALLEAKSYINRLEQELRDTDYNTIAVRYLDAGSEHFNDAVARYIKNKYLTPRWDYSGSSWVAGNHPLFKNSLPSKEIREDHFMLGHSMRDMRHKKYGTLGKAWDAYKKIKDKQQRKKFKEEHLRIAVMRVPSPEISGTRILYFDGFTNPKNTKYDYGTYLRQKDQFNIDGADVDGDKVFLYQGMPKDFLDAVYNKRNYLENADGTVKPNKDPKLDKNYDMVDITDPAKRKEMQNYINNKASQYMPNALYRAGRSSFNGKNGMGQVVTAKEYLQIILGDILRGSKGGITKKGKQVEIVLNDKDGDPYAYIKGITNLETLKKQDGFFTHLVESSSRTADSSKYYDLIDAIKMQDFLLNKAFISEPKLYAINKKGKKTNRLFDDGKVTYRMLRDSVEYGALFRVKNALYTGKGYDGKRLNLREIQKSMEAATKYNNNDGLSKRFNMSSLAILSTDMGRYNVNTDLLRKIEFKNFNEILESVNSAFKSKKNDKGDLFKKIAAQQFLILPDYGKVKQKAEDPKYTNREFEQILKYNDSMDMHSVLVVSRAYDLMAKEFYDKGFDKKTVNDIAEKLAVKAYEHRNSYTLVRSSSPNIKKDVRYNKTADVETAIRNFKNNLREQIKPIYDISSNRLLDYYEMYMLSSLSPQTKPREDILADNVRKLNEKKEELDTKKLPKPRKKQLKYEIRLLEDAVDNELKHYHKTSRHRFPYETLEISRRNKKVFLSTYADLFNLMRGQADVAKQVEVDPFVKQIKENVTKSEKGPQTDQQKDQQIKEEIESKITKQANLFDFNVEGKVKAPKEAQRASEDIVKIFKQFGEHSQEYLSDLFVAMTKERDVIGYGIEKATFRDIIDFRNYLQDQLNAAQDGKPSILTKFLFPARVAEKQYIHDWKTAETIKGIPFKDAKGRYGTTDIRVPLGTMKGLQNSFRNIYNFQNIAINLGQEERDNHFTIRKDILDRPDGVDKMMKLHESAMHYHLQDKGLGKQREYNEQKFEENKKQYESLAKEEFQIIEKGATKTITGKEVMDIIIEQKDSFMNPFFNKWGRSNLDFSLVDPDPQKQLTADYKRFNKQSPILKFNEKTGRSNIERIYEKYFEPFAQGKQNIDKLIGKGGLSTELLFRWQYEYQLENFIKQLNIKNKLEFREKYRQRTAKYFDEDGTTKYDYSKTAFSGIGEVKDGYWPHMMHMSTRKGKEEAELFMKRKRQELRLGLMNEMKKQFDFFEGSGFDYPVDRRFQITKNDKNRILNEVTNKAKEDVINEIINEKIAKLENMYEQQLGSALTDDNGSGEHAAKWASANYTKVQDGVNDGFFSRPGSGRARGEEPMPGYSYDFKVIETYQNQWINAFYKNLTAIISKRNIDLYKEADPLQNKKLTKEWAEIMQDYTSDVLGYEGMFSRSNQALTKAELKDRRDLIARYDKAQKQKLKAVTSFIGRQEYLQAKEDIKINNRIKNKVGDTINNAFYYLSDQAVVNGLNNISEKFWMGGKDKAPKIPIWGELPKSPEARRRVLSRIVNQLGNAEAKYSLISLLSHPKTAVGNLLGGSHNTIANAGLSNFIDASFNKKKLLSTIFRDARLKDGTKITTTDHLNRFAEEVGAIESFIVTEASLERNFRSKEAKGFLRELVNFKKTNPDEKLDLTSIKELASKYKLGERVVQAGAYFMRVSERKLRSDSFYAHYLNAYDKLKNVIPNLKYDNPYVINMALKGVEATQFLYHSAFRPKYSRTALGKVMTRFHPFAWNSIRFRRLTYQRAKRYGFREGTESFNQFKRLATLDIFAIALANAFVSSIFDSTLPPPLSWMQDTADWVFGDEKERDRAFFSSWPHPILAPLQIATPPVARFGLAPINAMVNGNWDRFSDYYLWTFFPFGRLARSTKKTFEVPEMWLEQMTGIPIHGIAREMDKNNES